MMSRFAQTLRGLAPCNPLNCYTRATRFVSQLIVTKLSFYTTDEDLVTLCSPFGVVKGARLIMDPKTRRHRGYGFVTFEKEIEAQKAVKALNGRIVKGRMIFVEFVRDKTDGQHHSGQK